MITALVALGAGCTPGADAWSLPWASEGEGEGEGPIDVGQGADAYGNLCARCHGADAEGGSAMALRPWTRSRDELIAIIDEAMPVEDPSLCVGACAITIADWLLQRTPPDPEPLDCTVPAPAPPATLRLLTRAEYDATVHDLLAAIAPTCGGDEACALDERCGESAACVPNRCDVVTFVLDPQGAAYSSVHVAGSFNGWPAAHADASALTLVFDGNVWSGSFTLPSGDHTYKLVVNDSEWRTDTRNPLSVADGFGGQNSRIAIDCADAPEGEPDRLDQSFTARFPVESRPPHFPFDNSESALVTSVHAEESINAAERLGLLAARHPERLVACALTSATCRADFVRSFGARAFRRPLTDDEAARFNARWDGAETREEGLAVVVGSMLASSSFLYRSELGADIDGVRVLDAYEIASALSYLLWGTMPDAALFSDAASGALDSADGREVAARRMLEDPRARDAAGRFALQWLGVEKVLSVDKTAELGTAFTPSLRAAMLEETRDFFVHVMFDGTGVYDELLLADFTLAGEALAALYGVQSDATLVPLPADRRGLLSHGSVLATLAYPDQTSPVRRGLFVRERVLCQSLGTPPPNAGAIPPVETGGTTRERFEIHSTNAQCNACHRHIDPLGFGFEGFDAIGRARSMDNGFAVDTSGELTDVEALGAGTSAPFSTVPELAALLAGSEQAPLCYAIQLQRFASGRLEEEADACAVAALGDAFAAQGFDLKELIVTLVRDERFVRRTP